jgi:phosphoglycerol transferase MdoB-like AlkP superfamily enzyme
MWGLGLLLLTRLVFFLPDNTNDVVEQIIIWLIFLLSLAFLGYIIYKDKIKIKKYISVYKDKVYMLIHIFLLEFGLLVKNRLGFNHLYVFAIALMSLVIVFISLLLPKKVSKIFDVIFIMTYAIYVVGQDYYYRIFGDFFSFKEYGTIKEGFQFSEGMYEFSLLHVYIAIVTFVTMLFYFLEKSTSHVNFSFRAIKRMIMYPLILFFLTNINAQFPINLARLHMSDHYLYTSVFSKEKFVSRYGAVNLLVKDGLETLTPNFSTKRDKEYIDDYFENNIKLHSDNEYTGVFEGMNLIFIIGESFDSIAVDEYLTPYLYRLKTEGLDFQNHYTPVFPRTTCDSEIIFNTSIIPSIQDGPTCYTYNSNSYSTSLANLFNNKGYQTTGFHSNYKEFYTRGVVYDGLQYDNFYGQHELYLDELEKRYDSTFFEKTIEYSINEDEPFFSMLLTLSGHSPYDSSNIAAEAHFAEVDEYYGDSIPESIKYYIASQMETEVMVQKLFEYLENIGILDDTVIVLTNDHYPYALNQEDYELYKNIEEDYEKSKGVMYIWGRDIEHTEIDKLSSSFDFLPTIINMFGLDGNFSNYVGNDVFSDDNAQIVYFKDYSIYDGEAVYDISSGEIPGNSDIVQIAQNYYEICRKILNVNYFKRD